MFLVVLGIGIVFIMMVFLSRVKQIKNEKPMEEIIMGIIENEGSYYKDFSLKNDEGDSFTCNVLLTKRGIFLLSSYEDITGNIYGDDDKFNWVQALEHRKLNINNPIIRFKNFSNEFKIKYSRDFENLKINFIHCFSKRATIKIKSKYHVIYLSDLEKTIGSYKDEIFSDEEMNTLMNIFSGKE